MASLVVSASGKSLRTQGAALQAVACLSAAIPRVSSVGLRWVSAINNDSADELLDIAHEHSVGLLLELRDDNGKTALMVAAKTGHMHLAQLLVEAGANIDEVTDMLGTAFMFAVLGGEQEIACWLVEQGADVNKIGSNGWTAVTIACSKGDVAMLHWLISLGVDTRVRDVYGFTPLTQAVSYGCVEAAAALLSLVETDVNAQDEAGNTPLHYAVSAQQFVMVSLLIQHKANPSILNNQGLSALDLTPQKRDRSKNTVKGLSDTAIVY